MSGKPMTMWENLEGYRLVLASNSPRRRELLQQLGLPFTVRTLPGIDESYPGSLQGGDIPMYISRKKAEAYRPFLSADEVLLTADTVVWLDGEVYGKPANGEEACRMLRRLSGRTHQVYTGVCLTSLEKQLCFCDESQVTFAPLSDEEIRWYVDHDKPLDKAGAYGIQEWIGLVGVEKLEGSYFNVMGLPVQQLYVHLRQF